MTRPLQEFMVPYDNLLSPQEMEALKSRYDQHALELGTLDGKLYYLPRKLETRMMCYLKSKAAEAADGWTAFRPMIEDALKHDNGWGLPREFQLNKDPNLWDYYDMFVAGYYWAHTPYFSITMPRMAHRGKKYGGTVVGLIDRIYQMGGGVDDVLKMSTDPVVDMFMWEAVYRKHGLYNPGMWQDPWSGGGIWNAMKDGKVFLAMMHQIDSFFIHGGTHPHMQGYLADPDDMGLAVMPMGGSFELDSAGRPLRMGTRKAGTAGWFWGIPATAPHPRLSAEFALWITNYQNHLKECQVFGMMPIRRDITEDVRKGFPKGWMAEVFATSAEQIALNGDLSAPMLRQYADVGKVYLEAWYDIVVDEHYGQGGAIDRQYIRERLLERYVRALKEILGDHYPR